MVSAVLVSNCKFNGGNLMANTNPPRVAPKDQGPNEQSIVAAGSTVEEWKKTHPHQPLGPAPEEIDQITTDPPDGSDPDVEQSAEAARKAFPTATNPEIFPPEGGENPRNPQDPNAQDTSYHPPTYPSGGGQPIVDQPNPHFEPPQAAPTNVSGDAGQPSQEGDADQQAQTQSHGNLTTHAQLDGYAQEQGLELPDDWDNKTVASKKAWLDENA
jgi:hypothetical protein